MFLYQEQILISLRFDSTNLEEEKERPPLKDRILQTKSTSLPHGDSRGEAKGIVQTRLCIRIVENIN